MLVGPKKHRHARDVPVGNQSTHPLQARNSFPWTAVRRDKLVSDGSVMQIT